MAFVQLSEIPVIEISAQSDLVYWSCCPNPTLPPGKWDQYGPEPKRVVVSSE